MTRHRSISCAFDGLISADPDIVSASFACVAKGGRGRFFTDICSSTVVKILIFSVLKLIIGDLAVFFPLDDDLSGADVFQKRSQTKSAISRFFSSLVSCLISHSRRMASCLVG